MKRFLFRSFLPLLASLSALFPLPLAQSLESYPGPLEWEVVLEPDQPWEYGHTSYPWVLYEEGLYRMWYTVGNSRHYDNNKDYWGGIAYAESDDGSLWRNKQLLFASQSYPNTEEGIFAPIVIRVNDGYRLYTTQHYKSISRDWSTFVTSRTSPDGLTWSPWTAVMDGTDAHSWEVYNFVARSVFPKSQGGLCMVYDVMFKKWGESSYPMDYLAYAHSDDGMSWPSRSRVLGDDGLPIHVPHFAPYSAFGYTQAGIYRWLYPDGAGHIRVASSTDSVHWKGIRDGDLRSLSSALLSPPPNGARFPSLLQASSGEECLYFTALYPEGQKIARASLRTLNVGLTAHVEPSAPRTQDDLECVTTLDNYGGYPDLSWSYRWFRDGEELLEGMQVNDEFFTVTGPTLSHLFTAKHQQFFSMTRVTDGTSSRQAATGPVVIANSTPTAPVVEIRPLEPQPGEDLGVNIVVYSVDPDGDPVDYRIDWHESEDGGEHWTHKVELTDLPFISGLYLQEGDLWRVEITPFETGGALKSGRAQDGTLLQGEAGWDQVYVGENHRPLVVIDSPGPQDVAAWPEVKIAWHTEDLDGDAVSVDLYYDADGLEGGSKLIARGLDASGAVLWRPDLPVRESLPGDLSGNGRLDSGDVFLFGSCWQRESRARSRLWIFARAWDSKGAIGEALSDGAVVLPEGWPPTPAGLQELLRQWRTGR